MKLLSWNVNGYRSIWKKGFLEWLHATDADMVCLQETKAWDSQLSGEQIQPPGYYSVFSRPERKGYSGVVTFSRQPFTVHQKGFGIDKYDKEGRVIITDHGKFLLANIYFPNGVSKKERLDYKLEFYDATLEYFKKLKDAGKNIVVVGDYNTAHKPIDLARPKDNTKRSGFLPEERAWIDKWVDAGFVDTFREFNDQPDQYTWWDLRTRARERNIGWRIDYFFVSENMQSAITDARIHMDQMGSDHCPIELTVDTSKL